MNYFMKDMHRKHLASVQGLVNILQIDTLIIIFLSPQLSHQIVMENSRMNPVTHQ